ncbi:MAG: hypothetical protein J2P52_13475 [Blastocatellia bacterium]|nr:hypothetical protein [Blastocatellia bacterium]
MIDLGSMTDKFSEAGQNVVRRAIELSKTCDHNFLSLSHIFIALTEFESELFAETMRAIGVDPHVVKSRLNEELSEIPQYSGRRMAIPEPTRNLFNRALRRARGHGRQRIESYDLFATLFTDTNGAPAEILRRLGVDPALVTDAISQPVRAREKPVELLRSRMKIHPIQALTFSGLTPDSLSCVATINEKGVTPNLWDGMNLSLTEQERRQVEVVISSFLNKSVLMMNEATIWSRAIYPLLVLAEEGGQEAWSQMPLKAQFLRFSLKGIADGVVGHNISGLAKSFHLVIVQVKRESEAQDPLIQLYGAMLTAAGSNWALDNRLPQEIYGCYTIADNWIFAHGLVDDLEAPRPEMTVALSRAYSEMVEAETILRILKSITGRFAAQ